MPENVGEREAGQRAPLRRARSGIRAPNVAAREAVCAEVRARDRRDDDPPVRRRRRDRGAGDRGARAARRRARTSTRSSRRSAAAGSCPGTVDRGQGARRRRSRVCGAEPANAGDAARSFRYRATSSRCRPATSRSPTGCARRCPPRTLGAIRAHVDAVETCSEEAIVRAMRMTWEREKIVDRAVRRGAARVPARSAASAPGASASA